MSAADVLGPLTAARKRWILVAAVLGSSVTFIDASALGVALPAIQRDLHAGPAQAQWISNAYLLVLGALVLVGGAAGDRFGRRKIFLIGVTLFTLASIGCGAARTVDLLIAFRSIQGFGAALLTPGALALIGAWFPPDERGKAFGTWAGVGAITGMAGPIIGGWLADHADWRFIFWLNVPLAALTIATSLRFVPESRDESARSLDVVGAALAISGLGALTWGLTAAPDLGLASVPVLTAISLGAAGIVAFVVSQRVLRAPMMPLALFRSRAFSGVNGLTLLLYFALGGAMFFLPFELIRVQGFTAAESGAALLPFAVVMGLFSGLAGRLADTFGARLSLSVGPLVAGLGFFALGVPGPGAGFVDGPLTGMSLLAIGMTLAVGPLTATVMGAVSSANTGVASGINNAVARIASLLAVALLGLVLSGVFVARAATPDARAELGRVMAGADSAPAAIAAFHAAFGVVMDVCAACAVLAGVIGLLTAPARARAKAAR
jgi:EmrB/QacA subfamily drug resistance transporter